MPRLVQSKRQWIYIFLSLIVFILMLGLNSSLSEYFRLSSQKNEMTERIVKLESTQIAIETQIAYAKSDKAVEEWARTYAKQVLPGDELIVPLPEENNNPRVNYLAEPTPDNSENWQIWWKLFFE